MGAFYSLGGEQQNNLRIHLAPPPQYQYEFPTFFQEKNESYGCCLSCPGIDNIIGAILYWKLYRSIQISSFLIEHRINRINLYTNDPLWKAFCSLREGKKKSVMAPPPQY